ncbi:hypothetical protein PROFUN_15669 [Planoprotostelium fungivorum]|uniref:C2H2-type domain-containing protein n=1 Tax=Planoprotostelium fungivorum TaxID=1890364 RepID=A0A2P6MS67_9EUKA|nr:hypothetical protein PROFUN_15669 [Planoprotostelium fungivorum]
MPTERQLLVHSLKSLGYIGDLRKGKQSDCEKLLKEHQNASKLGFQYAQWDLQTLQQKIKKVFTAIRFLFRIKPKTTLLTAGVASQYDYTFLPDTWFSKSVSAVAQICSKTNAVLPVILDDLNNTLQLWIQNSFAADDSVPDTKHRVHEFITFKLKLAKSQQGGCKGYTVDAGLKNKRCLKNPDLKDNLCFWRLIANSREKGLLLEGINTLHNVVKTSQIMYKLKESQKKKGGDVVTTVRHKTKSQPAVVTLLYHSTGSKDLNQCLKNPDLKDNLCFWRCITIVLYESSCQGIQQANSKQQREKAIALRDQYFAQCGQNISDHVQVADLPAICQALNLDLTVYTLDDNLDSLKLYESGIQGSPICLHLDQPKNHHMLLMTLVGYAETIICDKCKKVFSYSNSTKYHKHMAKHQKDQNSSKVLVFKDKPIQSSTSLYKQSFGTEHVRPLFLAYDFECILKKMKNNEVNQKTTYTHSHEPIGVVMLAGGCLADQARDLEYEYCLLKTYFWNHHNKQMAVIESQKCSCQYTAT